jgi:hypothetical protein
MDPGQKAAILRWREPIATNREGVSMANQNEPNSATQPADKNQATNQPSQSNQQANSGMVRRSQDAGMARSQRRGGGLGFPISPYDTLRMSPFGLLRRMTEVLDRALQPLLEIVMPAPKQQTEKRQIQIEGDNKASSGQNKQAAA